MERKVYKSREQIAAEKRNPPENVRCRCIVAPSLTDSVKALLNMAITFNPFIPIRILKNGEATVVFWQDGTKTVVKPANGVAPNDYEAFTAALAKKIFGNNSALKKVIQRKTVIQKPKRKKEKPYEADRA